MMSEEVDGEGDDDADKGDAWRSATKGGPRELNR